MRERLPVVDPVERALHLRSIPLFCRLGAPQLAVLAQLMHEQWIRRGAVIHTPGQRVNSVHLLVEGRVRCVQGDQPVRFIEAPQAVGLLDLLADRVSPELVVAESNILALVIDSGAFLDVVEDHFGIVLQIRAALGTQVRELQRQLDRYPVRQQRAVKPERTPGPTLDIVQRLIWLKPTAALNELGTGVLAALVRDEPEFRLNDGESLWEKDAEAQAFVLIVHGTVVCTFDEPTAPVRVGVGAVIGIEAVLGGVPYAYGAVAETPLVAIRITTAALLDIAEDQPPVAMWILAYSARLLLELQREALSRSDGTGRAPEAAPQPGAAAESYETGD